MVLLGFKWSSYLISSIAVRALPGARFRAPSGSSLHISSTHNSTYKQRARAAPLLSMLLPQPLLSLSLSSLPDM